MAIRYGQLAQDRTSGTGAVSLYQAPAEKYMQGDLRIANQTTNNVTINVYHDDDGSTYDEDTAIMPKDYILESGEVYIVSPIYMDDENGNLAYQTSVGDSVTATLYGIEEDK